MAVKFAVLVEFLKQFTANRHAESHHRIFHGMVSSPGAQRDEIRIGLAGQFAFGTSTQSPSCFELATAASMKAMPATPSAIPGCGNGFGTVSPRPARIV